MNLRVETKLSEKGINREKTNLLLFLSGKSISLFGSGIYTFALSLYLLKITGSGLTFATNIILYTLPLVIINPIAGVIVDRVSKRIVVIGSDLLNGIFLLLIYVLIGRIGISIPLIYISTFLITLLAVFFNVAIEASKPNLVGKEKLVEINSIGRVVESASSLIGPIAGGLIYSLLDIKLFILINALSFLIAAALEYFIDYEYNTSDKKSGCLENPSKKSIWSDMKDGYGYIFSRKHMKALVCIFIAQNFFFNYTILVPIPYLLNNIWGIETSIYGIVQGGLPAGMIIGAFMVKRILDKIPYSVLLKIINYSIAVAALILGFPMLFSIAPNQSFVLSYYTILMFINGFMISWIDVPLNILLQQIVPEKILGRVFSVVISIVKIIVPIALLSSGFILSFTTPLTLFISGSMIMVVFNMLFFSSSLGKDFIDVSNRN